MPNHAVRRAAANLPADPTQEQLLTAAEAVALAALESAVKVPGRAVTRYVAHYFKGHPARTRDGVRQGALAVLDREAPRRHDPSVAAATATGPLFWPLKTFAAMTGQGEREVKARLKYPQWRRAWGWPRCWNGVDFWFPIAAIENPASVIGLPPIEPSHPLPGWCLRVEDIADMDVFPEVGETSWTPAATTGGPR